jgi:hypothetical protein
MLNGHGDKKPAVLVPSRDAVSKQSTYMSTRSHQNNAERDEAVETLRRGLLVNAARRASNGRVFPAESSGVEQGRREASGEGQMTRSSVRQSQHHTIAIQTSPLRSNGFARGQIQGRNTLTNPLAQGRSHHQVDVVGGSNTKVIFYFDRKSAQVFVFHPKNVKIKENYQ